MYALYIYLVLGMFWATDTIHMFTFSVCANLTANVYFLDGTEYAKPFLLLRSLKKGFLTFGSSAFAGLIATLLTFLERCVKKTT